MSVKNSVRMVVNNWREVSLRLDRNIDDGVKKVGAETLKQIGYFITDLPGEPSEAARARGGSGLVDTGNYRRSWFIRRAGKNSVEVGSPVEYGVYLEYGTRKMRAFPHVVPAAEVIKRSVERYFARLDRR